ncbi:MAG: LamG domain-containing protein [Aliivibrio sp.]|nr:LamG domain-containing protein [Aliivibrio sp.]
MAIKSGETTYHQAKRGIVQNGLVLNLDAGVDASYDGGTTWRDLEGGNDGTLTNMTDNFDSANGGSLTFDGSNEQVIGTNSELLSFGDGSNDSPFSLSCWCYLAANSPASNFPLIAKYRSYQPFRGEYSFSVISGNKLIMQCVDGTTTVRCRRTSVDSLSTNRWYNLVSTYNANGSDSGLVLYLNGVVFQSSGAGEDGSYVAMQRAGDPSELTIGGFLDEGNTFYQGYFNGNISNVSIYNRALTATEVLQNYNVTRHRFGV